MRYQILSTILFSTVFALSVNCQGTAVDEKVKSCKFLSTAEAEKILGETVEMVSAESASNNKSKSGCTYRRVTKDQTSGREISLFFLLEESPTQEQAKQIYQTLWNSNKDHQGIEVLRGIGDEAYAHSDRPNFHFVMTRKGKFTVKLKVNKAVETTSFDELKAFARKVTEQI